MHLLTEKNPLLLAVDVGTSATKAILFDTSLKPVALSRRAYPIYNPQKGWSEQQPGEIYQAVLEAIGEASHLCPPGCDLAGVVFSSQMYSVLAVDQAGEPLTPSLTWSDTRSAPEAAWIRSLPEANDLYRRTGCPIDAIYPLSKIRWLRAAYPLLPATRFVSIKDYVIYKLTGHYLADWCTASASGLFDIHAPGWFTPALDLLGLSPTQLPELAPPRTILNHWTPQAADQVGTASRAPIILGAGDGPLASLGVGAWLADILAVNVGTSAAARAIIHQPLVDAQGRLWTYLLDDRTWVMGGIVSSGGMVYEWFLNTFLRQGEQGNAAQNAHAHLEKLAASVPPGAEGLLFIPYLSGEQCPTWQPLTRGSFFGLDLKHSAGHFARAVLEGITQAIIYAAHSLQNTLGVSTREVRVSGGLTASPLWLQIAADMFGVPVAVSDTAEGSARGAAILGWLALGEKSGLDDFAGLFPEQAKILPRAEVTSLYQVQRESFLHILELVRNYAPLGHVQAIHQTELCT